MINPTAWLVLADGSVFSGQSVGADGERVGELVFNTSMTGYQEMLTDPSYAGQLITLTTPHIGNVGCNADDMESTKVWAAGLVIRHCTTKASNYRSDYDFSTWLIQNDVVAIAEVDTRALTHRLRQEGAIGACITTDGSRIVQAQHLAATCPSLKGMDLAKIVSRQTIEPWQAGEGEWAKSKYPQQYQVVVYDFGVKHNILRLLCDLGCALTIVPAQTPAEEVMAMQPDGIVLSNGPGDPTACAYAIAATRVFLQHKIPLLGICLGFQILALACGAQAKKMSFGHHGANHPVIEIDQPKRVFITSQNHGFAIDEASLPKTLIATHRSLFDQSLQGIMHRTSPAFGFQGHPEASPGPHDVKDILSRFIHYMDMKFKNLN